jgi:hypothetical protein
MTLRFVLLAVAAFAMLVAGVSVAGANRGQPATITWFEDPAHEAGSPVIGSYAVQQRGYYSITAQLHSRNLTPGHRYTVWWVVYNTPSACAEGCDISDATSALTTGVNPAGIGVLYGGTSVVAASGRLDVGSRIIENSVVPCPDAAPYVALCNPLIDAAIAEATVFLLDHGPATDAAPVAGPAAFSAGCKSFKSLDTVVAVYGETGFECFSPQSVHLP